MSVGRTSGYLVVSRCIRPWTTTHPSRLDAGPRRSPLRDVVVVTRARANERDARTNDRRNTHGYFFLDDIVMTLAGTRECECERDARARFARECDSNARIDMDSDSVTRANATRETRETRQGARGMFWIFFLGRRALASASRGRRAVVDGRARADDDGPSTGRNVAGVDAGGVACVWVLFDGGLGDLSMGCGRFCV